MVGSYILLATAGQLSHVQAVTTSTAYIRGWLVGLAADAVWPLIRCMDACAN